MQSSHPLPAFAIHIFCSFQRVSILSWEEKFLEKLNKNSQCETGRFVCTFYLLNSTRSAQQSQRSLLWETDGTKTKQGFFSRSRQSKNDPVQAIQLIDVILRWWCSKMPTCWSLRFRRCEEFKFRGWYDAAFRLGQETHQILFEFQQTRWASRSKSRSRSQDVSSLAFYPRRIANRKVHELYAIKNCQKMWILSLTESNYQIMLSHLNRTVTVKRAGLCWFYLLT